MNIYDVLKKDHRTVEGLFAKIEKLRNGDEEERMDLFLKLKQELTLHAKAEQKVFYDPLKDVQGMQRCIAHAYGEHKEIEVMLEDLSRKSENGEDWMNTLLDLKEIVEHHVEEEEEEIFSQAKEVLTKKQEEKMAEQMLDAKEKIRDKVEA